MPYPEAKIYKDGISYIAIPHTTRPKRPRPKRMEEVITVTEEIETKPILCPKKRLKISKSSKNPTRRKKSRKSQKKRLKSSVK